MKTLTFTYTKKDGSVSNRTLLAQVTPTDKFAGIDLSELDPELAAEFVEDAKYLYADYINELQQLQKKYELQHSYRQFLAPGVSNLTEI